MVQNTTNSNLTYDNTFEDMSKRCSKIRNINLDVKMQSKNVSFILHIIFHCVLH